MRSPRSRAVSRSAALAAACTLLAGAAFADLIVPAGGTVSLGGGTIDLGCSDVVVGGGLQLGAGAAAGTRNLTILAGGTLDAGSGAITLAGGWSNGGTFNSGSGTVSFVDAGGCSVASTISGGTTFYDLSLISSTGKVYTFEAGMTQTVANSLTIQGVAGTPLQIVSNTPGVQGNLNLSPGGTQSIAHVGVTDNWATGQPLAPFQTNEGGGGNARGWFGQPLQSTGIPALGGAGLIFLAFLIGTMAVLAIRRPRETTHAS